MVTISREAKMAKTDILILREDTSYQRRKRSVCTNMNTEAPSLRGTMHSDRLLRLRKMAARREARGETCRSCHYSGILTGRRASRERNTDTKQCLLVRTGNRKLAAHGHSQPTDVFCLARVMFKKFFELVASILKLRFHIKFWILRLLLKNLEDINTGSASHIITRGSWSSEQLSLRQARRTERSARPWACPLGEVAWEPRV